ncbi:hypothetical protein OROMI_007119 [Orobanche minor]
MLLRMSALGDQKRLGKKKAQSLNKPPRRSRDCGDLPVGAESKA